MKKTRNGRRRYSREFKIAAVRRVMGGEAAGAVARDLGVNPHVLWRWRKQVAQKGEDQLQEWGRPKQIGDRNSVGNGKAERRIAELERLVGRQQMEIRFLDKALRRVEELRQPKNGSGGKASSKG